MIILEKKSDYKINLEKKEEREMICLIGEHLRENNNYYIASHDKDFIYYYFEGENEEVEKRNIYFKNNGAYFNDFGTEYKLEFYSWAL